MPIPTPFADFEPFSEDPYAYHPTDTRFLRGDIAKQMNQFMRNAQGMIGQYQKERPDTAGIGRGIDASYFNSIALQPSVQSNLKGMGVDAAEGTAALSQSLPLMQARAEGKADLWKVDQMYLQNLMGMINQMHQLGLAGQGNLIDLYKTQLNFDLNK